MMEHFAIDLLNEYRTEEIPETKRPVVNPKWRELDRQKRSVKSKLTHRQARFAALTLHPESDEAAQAKWEKRKAELVEEIEQFEHELTDIDSQLKTDAQPPRVGRVAGDRKVPAPGSQPQATGRHREDDRLPRRDGDGFNRARGAGPD